MHFSLIGSGWSYGQLMHPLSQHDPRATRNPRAMAP